MMYVSHVLLVSCLVPMALGLNAKEIMDRKRQINRLLLSAVSYNLLVCICVVP